MTPAGPVGLEWMFCQDSLPLLELRGLVAGEGALTFGASARVGLQAPFPWMSAAGQ